FRLKAPRMATGMMVKARNTVISLLLMDMCATSAGRGRLIGFDHIIFHESGKGWRQPMALVPAILSR
ncbi:MAG TPA: hypothetical protein VM658_20860, partial [bacterium]|nr:hypothetical protein [bacterium]